MALKTVRDILVAASGVTSLVSQRVSYEIRQQDTVLPAVTLLLVSTVPMNHMRGQPTLDSNRVQVDCWAETKTAVWQLADACRAAMEAANCVMLSGSDGEYEPDVLAYRVTQDFSVWT